MEKETFRKEVKELLANAYQRMVKNVDISVIQITRDLISTQRTYHRWISLMRY